MCGAVRYEVDQLDMPVAHCHCATCRKAHAAACASTAGVMHGHFRWTAGEEKLSAYGSSPGKLRRFRSLYGTHLLAERPAMHIWTSHDAPWLAHGEDVPRYPEWQPGR